MHLLNYLLIDGLLQVVEVSAHFLHPKVSQQFEHLSLGHRPAIELVDSLYYVINSLVHFLVKKVRDEFQADVGLVANQFLTGLLQF